MTAERCPSCNAALAPQAQWCSLCYADLRTHPAPTVDYVPVQPSPTPVLDPLSSPLAVLEAEEERPAAAPSLPCRACDAAVPLGEMACPVCLVPLLADETPLPTGFLGVQLHRLRSASKGQRIAIGAIGMVVMSSLLLLVMYVVGSLL